MKQVAGKVSAAMWMQVLHRKLSNDSPNPIVCVKYFSQSGDEMPIAGRRRCLICWAKVTWMPTRKQR